MVVSLPSLARKDDRALERAPERTKAGGRAHLLPPELEALEEPLALLPIVALKPESKELPLAPDKALAELLAPAEGEPEDKVSDGVARALGLEVELARGRRGEREVLGRGRLVEVGELIVREVADEGRLDQGDHWGRGEVRGSAREREGGGRPARRVACWRLARRAEGKGGAGTHCAGGRWQTLQTARARRRRPAAGCSCE